MLRKIRFFFHQTEDVLMLCETATAIVFAIIVTAYTSFSLSITFGHILSPFQVWLFFQHHPSFN